MRLGPEARRARFDGPKPFLTTGELGQLARVDATRHALVGYVDGDPLPVAIARLVRDGRSAEIAFGVADAYQGRGIGSALAAALHPDARAAGSRTLSELVASDNRAAVALLRRVLEALGVRLEGAELWISGLVPAQQATQRPAFRLVQATPDDDKDEPVRAECRITVTLRIRGSQETRPS